MLTLKGSPGSPYTRKMLALLRYRHIPYRLLQVGSREADTLPNPRVALLPTFYLPDDNGAIQAVTDSTPLLRRFEQAYQPRSVVPANPLLRFIDYLLEDYADEWLTKAMFHYRWHYPADAGKATAILPYWHNLSDSDDNIRHKQQAFAQRQTSRLPVVGSNAQTQPLIEASYRRFLTIFESHLGEHAFLMGERPGASDFAVFGQLTCLARFDPTPAAIALSSAPRVYAWVSLVDDLSGAQCHDHQWLDTSAVADTLRPLLSEIGRSYTPVMLANAAAVMAGDQTFETEVDGARWRQQTFPYQAKCLSWIRAEYQRLDETERAAVDRVLNGTGCERLLVASTG